MKKEVKEKLVKAFKFISCKMTLYAKKPKNVFNKNKPKFAITQKTKHILSAILSNTTTKFKQSSTHLKPKISAKMQTMAAQVKNKAKAGISNAPHKVSVHVTQKQKRTILISTIAVSAILNVFFLTTISAQYFTKSNIYSYGTVQIQTQTAGLNVYGDSSCTALISSLPWGNIVPGGTITNTVYVKNEGNVPLTLTLDTTSWNPSNAPNYISLRWDYNGQALEPNQSVRVRLMLTVSQSVNGIENFNFEIVVNGNS
ncbi:MAG: hypothetical protein IAX21_02410 [Candidatus Bathyarchaeota archaeon]|nr:hypothetical protein [Candidatus Bathyarchaeum tardum]WGM90128.1 MAG: hypothetical protein NUK63_03170 [Candidatus Bathyarchaeum tardum]WNZ29738.1 MAG: hypothetical protein IAX21_02410 [Candidatus Bathyarchaeota archaeon]